MKYCYGLLFSKQLPNLFLISPVGISLSFKFKVVISVKTNLNSLVKNIPSSDDIYDENYLREYLAALATLTYLIFLSSYTFFIVK
jgi:hypothetical protein